MATWMLVTLIIFAVLGTFFTTIGVVTVFRSLYPAKTPEHELVDVDGAGITVANMRGGPAGQIEPDSNRNKYGVKFPSRFQLDEIVTVKGSRVRVVGVSFALLDLNDGWGEHPKILYTVEHPSGVRSEVYSKEAYPATQLSVVK